MNVFVYGAEDHEGSLLAEVVRRFDTDGQFRFLPLSAGSAMRRLHWFVTKWHPLPAAGGVAALPMVVVMQDRTGRHPESHRVIRGPQLEEWFAALVQTVLQRGPPAIAAIRDVVFQSLAPQTLHMMALALALTQQERAAAAAAGGPHPAAAVPEEEAAEPDAGAADDDDAAAGEDAGAGAAATVVAAPSVRGPRGPAPAPPPPPGRTALRVRRGAGPAAAGPPSAALAPPPPAAALGAGRTTQHRQAPAAAAMTAVDVGSTEAWEEATVPDVHGAGGSVSAVEVAMSQAKVREGASAAVGGRRHHG